jgi:hypothetical protein
MTADVPLLSEYLHFLETGELKPGAFAPDVFFDMNVPSWRYQVQGHEDAAALRAKGGVQRLEVGAVVATSEGFAAETNYDALESGEVIHYRAMNLVTVRDGKITEVVHYCTGPWDRQTRERQAREAPMLR